MDTTISIQDFVNNVKSNGFRAMRETVTHFIRSVMETVLFLEQQDQMGCQRYERSQQRVDYANGSYERTVSTTYGVISNLRIPRLRRSRFITKLLETYKRRTNELDHALLTWYLQGESCRDVTRSINAWTQDILSAQSVSRLIQNIDQELLSWRQRPLPSDLTAVWLDGFSIKTRVKQKVRSCVILAALGRHPDGKWEILSFSVSPKVNLSTGGPGYSTKCIVVACIPNSSYTTVPVELLRPYAGYTHLPKLNVVWFTKSAISLMLSLTPRIFEKSSATSSVSTMRSHYKKLKNAFVSSVANGIN
jgi:hypothetical protein